MTTIINQTSSLIGQTAKGIVDQSLPNESWPGNFLTDQLSNLLTDAAGNVLTP